MVMDYSLLVLFLLAFVNFEFIVANRPVDWSKVITENIVLTEKLKDTLLELPVHQGKDQIGIDESPTFPGLFSRLKSTTIFPKDIDQGDDVMIKPLALLDKIKSSVIGKKPEEEVNTGTTSNVNSSSSSEKLTNTDEKKFNEFNKEDEHVGKTSTIDDKSSTLGNFKSFVTRALLEEDGDYTGVQDFPKNSNKPLSFLKNIESKVIDGFGNDKDLKNGEVSSITKTNLSLFDSMKSNTNGALENAGNSLSFFEKMNNSITNGALGNILKNQNIVNTSKTNNNPSLFDNIRSSADKVGILGVKMDDQQVENTRKLEKQPILLENLKNSGNKAVGEFGNVKKSLSTWDRSSAFDWMEDKIERGKEEVKEEEKEKEEKVGEEVQEEVQEEGEGKKKDEEIIEPQDAIEFSSRTWNNHIFDSIKTRINEAIWEDHDKRNAEDTTKLGENEGNLKENILFLPQHLQVFSASEIDNKIDNRMNDREEDTDSATNDENVIDSQDDNIYVRILRRIQSWIRLLIQVLKNYCETEENRRKAAEEVTEKKKVFLPGHFDVFSASKNMIDNNVNNVKDGIKDKVTSFDQNVDDSENENFFSRVIKKIIS